MKRPLTDFFSDSDILASYMRTISTGSPCYGCEGPIAESHYRISCISNSVTAVLCCKCGSDLKRGAIQRRNARGQAKLQRPHMAPLTDKEIQGERYDRFQKLEANHEFTDEDS